MEIITCPYCEGIGKNKEDTDYPCPGCKGDGKVIDI